MLLIKLMIILCAMAAAAIVVFVVVWFCGNFCVHARRLLRVLNVRVGFV